MISQMHCESKNFKSAKKFQQVHLPGLKKVKKYFEANFCGPDTFNENILLG